MKLIQLSTLSCYWCEVAKQYAALRLKDKYVSLNMSNETDQEIAKKYLKGGKGYLQFFVVDKEDNVLSSIVGWSQKFVDKFIKDSKDV